MLNAISSFNSHTVYLVVEDLKHLLVLSIDEVTYHMELKKKLFQTHIKIPVQWHTRIWYTVIITKLATHFPVNKPTKLCKKARFPTGVGVMGSYKSRKFTPSLSGPLESQILLWVTPQGTHAAICLRIRESIRLDHRMLLKALNQSIGDFVGCSVTKVL